MTLEQAVQTWRTQATDHRSSEQLQRLVRDQHNKASRHVVVHVVFSALCLLTGIANFYGQYMINHDPLLVALLRALPVLMVLPIQIHVYRTANQRKRERETLLNDHHAWLTRWSEELESEARGPASWMFWGYATALILIVSISKWLDFQNGQDTLEECLVIPILAAGLLGAIGLFHWHYRTQFLRPQAHHYRQLLAQLNQAD